ncbi:MAG: helix-turn-helix domain-containing protein [Myxococcales bacterium]|nr:helix-turn-helix domain-containing protein [Myxococcales bacterium]
MKSVSEQDHFEILEVAPDASREEVERAYRLARSTYADDSLAGYSVFGEGDAQALLQRIDAAYRVLSNDESRRAYVESLRAEGSFAEVLPPLVEEFTQADALPGADVLAEAEEESDEFDGARLRRSRMRCGLEIEEIAEITKVNPTYLRSIEEERFSELPAAVYVRGFVSAYASCLGLDARRVAASYVRRLEERRGAEHRFPGRR